MKLKLAVLVVALGAMFWGASHYHIGAPPLPITCPSYDQVAHWWVPDSRLWTVYRSTPGPVTRGADTVQWLGYTEIGGCSQSVTIKAGAR